METEKVIISKYLAEFVKSLNGKITFNKESEYLVSFTLPREDWKKLFSETIKSGNNPFELYSWNGSIRQEFYN